MLRSNNISIQVYSLAYSPDGDALAAATGNAGVWLIDPQTAVGGAWEGAALATDPIADSAVFSPDGRTLAADFGSGLVTGPTKGMTSLPELSASLGGNVVFSPNGRLLFVGGQDASVHVYDAATMALGAPDHRSAARQLLAGDRCRQSQRSRTGGCISVDRTG